MRLHIIVLPVEIDSLVETGRNYAVIYFGRIFLNFFCVEIVQSHSTVTFCSDVHILLVVVLDLSIILELDLIALYVWCNKLFNL